MNARSEALESAATEPGYPEFGRVFHAHYPRIARVIARIVSDPSRAEELAADVFWKFLHNSSAQENPGGWLYRTAVRKALDELRRQQRRQKFERLLMLPRTSPSPEQVHAVTQDGNQVRTVLAALKARDSELLVLRSEGLSYQEIAGILRVNETSMGTLLRRAQQAFRKEYVKRYGQPNLQRI
jgi:RNA polymerase sigma-70 factor (ECF subfamily)